MLSRLGPQISLFKNSAPDYKSRFSRHLIDHDAHSEQSSASVTANKFTTLCFTKTKQVLLYVSLTANKSYFMSHPLLTLFTPSVCVGYELHERVTHLQNVH